MYLKNETKISISFVLENMSITKYIDPVNGNAWATLSDDDVIFNIESDELAKVLDSWSTPYDMYSISFHRKYDTSESVPQVYFSPNGTHVEYKNPRWKYRTKYTWRYDDRRREIDKKFRKTMRAVNAYVIKTLTSAKISDIAEHKNIPLEINVIPLVKDSDGVVHIDKAYADPLWWTNLAKFPSRSGFYILMDESAEYPRFVRQVEVPNCSHEQCDVLYVPTNHESIMKPFMMPQKMMNMIIVAIQDIAERTANHVYFISHCLPYISTDQKREILSMLLDDDDLVREVPELNKPIISVLRTKEC